MDFNLNKAQQALQQAARDFLGGEASEDAVRRLAAGDEAAAAALWEDMAGLGWMALAAPEVYGGSGDFIDITILLEEMGRAGLAGPYFASVVLGGSALVEGGSGVQRQRFLPALTGGKLKMTLAVAEAPGRYDTPSVQMEAVAGGGGYTLNGLKRFVPWAETADYIVCAVRTDTAAAPEDVTLLLVNGQAEGIAYRRLETFSGECLCDVAFDNVWVPWRNLLGAADGGGPVLAKILQRAAAGRCAEMLGAAGRVLEMTLQYARERHSFGQAVGAGQSVGHRCADMLLDIEASRLVAGQAAWRLNEGLDATREAAIAKAWVGRACRRIVASAQRVHGAAGFTEDHPLHRFARRVQAAGFSYGGPDFHLEQLAGMSR